MASAYARVVCGIDHPSVGLLSNGTEEHKGDPLHQQTYQLLKRMDVINFGGNIEGRDIMIGDCDVAVCDGFSGNIANIDSRSKAPCAGPRGRHGKTTERKRRETVPRFFSGPSPLRREDSFEP